ncbi:MAG: hypothetical protein RLP44_04600 [Aggregatilineales bacterium]
MSEPRRIGVGAKYAFWLTTDEQALVEFVKTMLCVVHVSEDGYTLRSSASLSAISDDDKPENPHDHEDSNEVSDEGMPLRVLVTIKDSFDADEAWHWIYSELDEEARYVRLDSIWDDAINGVL